MADLLSPFNRAVADEGGPLPVSLGPTLLEMVILVPRYSDCGRADFLARPKFRGLDNREIFYSLNAQIQCVGQSDSRRVAKWFRKWETGA